MGFLDFTWYYVVGFLVLLSILIYVHEWGHYWVARKNNVRVEVFSIGFGPEIYGWTNREGTRWKISAIPLGGYVKMFGESDTIEEGEDEERPLTEEEKAVSFHHKRLGQRAAIVAAGPIVNFLFAILVFAGLAAFVGQAIPQSAVGEVFEGSAAAEAGFKTGDRILAIGEEEVTLFSDIRRIVSASPSVPLNFAIARGDQNLILKATPKPAVSKNDQGETETRGLLGIKPNPDYIEYERQNPVMAIWFGIKQTYTLTVNILVYVGDLITGNRNADDLGGPIRIAKISGDMAQAGMTEWFFLMAMLSVNLGLINLFPIPMLDGGHLAFYAIEAVRRRPLGPKAQEYGFRFGLILVLMLLVFVTWNDIVYVLG